MPDEMNIITFIHTLPEGEKACSVLLCYHGPIEEGERVLRPIREFGPPLADYIRPMPYADAQALALSTPGQQNYLKSHFMEQVDNEAIDIMVEHFGKVTSPLSSIFFQYLGNASKRAESGQTAFGHRDALCEWGVNSVWLDPGESEVHIRWARELSQDMLPFSSGAYINQVGTEEEEGKDVIEAAFGNNFQRLAALKQRYDPTNLFSHNQNIRPRI